jgi:hypothetical protein
MGNWERNIGDRMRRSRVDGTKEIFSGVSTGRGIDQITIETPSPKRRIYWRLIQFIDWRVEIQSGMLVFSTLLVN